MPGAPAAAELICDTKQEGEQRFLRLSNVKVPHRRLGIRCNCDLFRWMALLAC